MNIKPITDTIDDNKETLKYNQSIFEITEGNLLKYLVQSLASELTPENLQDAITRAAPINVLRKITSKLSSLYSGDPSRTTENPSDQELVDFYVKDSDLNTHWSNANFNFNAYKNTALELYISGNKLKARSLPSMQFIPYSDNAEDPIIPTAIVKIMSNKEYWVYTDEYFMKSDEEGIVSNVDTLDNPYGIMPFTYINRSSYSLIPTIDTDTVQMTLLIGKLLVDINFGSKYQSNPILYGVDLNIEKLERSPNVFWNLKSDGDKKPEVGVVKADPNIQAQIDSVMQQLSLWLQTKDIRAGAVGSTSAERASSGISLMIQEMDTTENVNQQKKYFEAAESDFWTRLAIIHNYAVDNNLITETRKFSEPSKLEVSIEYPEMTIVEDPTVRENRVLAQLTAGVLSKREAIVRLNPKMDDDAVDELLEEAKGEAPKLTFNPLADIAEDEDVEE